MTYDKRGTHEGYMRGDCSGEEGYDGGAETVNALAE